MSIVLSNEFPLSVECFCVSDGADDFFGHGATLGIRRQRCLVELDNESTHTTHGENNCEYGRHQDASKFSVLDERYNEGSDKSCQSCQCESDLLRNTVLNKIGIGCNASCDLSSAELIEERDVLTKNCLQEVLANFARDVFAGIEKPSGRNIHKDVLTDSKIQEVETEPVQFVVEMLLADSVEEIVIKGSR